MSNSIVWHARKPSVGIIDTAIFPLPCMWTKKEKYFKALADAKTGDKICQMCISAEALTGVNYDEGWNGNTFMWVWAFFCG